MMLFCIAVEGSNSVFGIFENNLINWLTLVGLLIWLGLKYVPPLLATRKTRIESALTEAARAKSEGLSFLNAQQKRVQESEKEAENILIEAQQMAQSMVKDITEQTQRDVVALQRKIEFELENERRLAITRLRSVVARTVITTLEKQLPASIDSKIKSRLLDQFLDQLETSNN